MTAKRPFRSTAYRYHSEIPILVLTVLISVGVVFITALLTNYLSLILVAAIFIITFSSANAMQTNLMARAFLVQPSSAPAIAAVVESCYKRLRPGPLRVFVLREKIVNAYTFGLAGPKNIVLLEPMLAIMNPEELAFVIGHEMGHVALGHTWLNTFVGGLAGSPSPFGLNVIVFTVFQSWSRACELSCDRAGLLACGNLKYAISALLRLAAPNIQSEEDLQKVLANIDQEEETMIGQALETFQSHPLIFRRINELKAYAATDEYRQLQQKMNANLDL